MRFSSSRPQTAARRRASPARERAGALDGADDARDRAEPPDGADAAGLECSVCLRLYHEPTTLHCGHSFCRRCVVECMRHALRCPTCRVDVPWVDVPQVSLALQDALGRLFPAAAARRAAEEAAAPPLASASGVPSLPLFVLEPLLPGQVMQLHVFEPRYIRLVQRCLAEPALDRCFGMVAFRAGTVSAYGVSARMTQVTEVPGGRYYVTIKGERRFRTLRTWDLDGYRSAHVVWANDAAQPEPDDAPAGGVSASVLSGELRAALAHWLVAVESGGWERQTGQVSRCVGELGPMPPVDDLEGLGLWGAALLNPLPALGVAPEIRQRVLECTDSLARLRVVLEATELSLQHLHAPRLFSWLGGGWRLGRLLTVGVPLLLAAAVPFGLLHPAIAALHRYV